MAVTPHPVVPIADPQGRERLQRWLDGPHVEARDLVREWLSEPGHAPRPDLEMEEHRTQVLAWAKELAAAGGTGLGFPAEYGGGGDVGASVAAFETLAMGDLSLLVKCGVQFGLWGGAVLHLGTERHHRAYLADTVTMKLPGCFAMTETGHGSNVQQLETTAVYDPDTDEWVITTPTDSARKEWIGNAARDGQVAAVFAQLETQGEGHGVHAFVVPIRDTEGNVLPGVRIEDCGQKLGLDGVDNGLIWFDAVRVPRDALLDRYAKVDDRGVYSSPIENPNKRFFTMVGTLIQGRVSVCGAAINATKVAQVIAVRHAETRRQFGPPGREEVVLMEYRTHQRRLLPGIAKSYALHAAQEGMVAELDAIFSGEDASERHRRELETKAAGMKAIATEHATRVIQECREACGGAGYLRANRFAALKSDTDVFTTFEGDNTVLLQLAAKNLLTDYKIHFGDLDPLGLAGFFVGQAWETVAEKSAVREILGRLADDLLPGRDEEGDLLDRGTQLDLLRWRADHIMSGAARRMKGGMDNGTDPFEVLVDCQDHLVMVGRSHVDHLLAKAFSDRIETIEDPALRGVLDKLCSLYALSVIEAERGWYQEHGRLSSTRSKATIKAVNTLCGELRPHAALLTEAYGVPETAFGDAHRVTQPADAA
ncbi:MAG: acyl-CoA oxidase domain protein [Solirubrobacterales bacterium]|jgi:acyl-CoA oxidase|nr:acyl-CoA oxidase domain protein [Solirubrobacterales bacterium]